MSVDPTPAAVRLNLWTVCLIPPAKRLAPSTSRMLPMMLPVSEALTTPSSPSKSANMEMISSAALPKVAFSSPPIPGPSSSESSSVASPIRPASGMIAAAESTNSHGPGAPRNRARIVAGTKRSRGRSQPARLGSIQSRQDGESPPDFDPDGPGATLSRFRATLFSLRYSVPRVASGMPSGPCVDPRRSLHGAPPPGDRQHSDGSLAGGIPPTSRRPIPRAPRQESDRVARRLAVTSRSMVATRLPRMEIVKFGVSRQRGQGAALGISPLESGTSERIIGRVLQVFPDRGRGRSPGKQGQCSRDGSRGDPIPLGDRVTFRDAGGECRQKVSIRRRFSGPTSLAPLARRDAACDG